MKLKLRLLSVTLAFASCTTPKAHSTMAVHGPIGGETLRHRFNYVDQEVAVDTVREPNWDLATWVTHFKADTAASWKSTPLDNPYTQPHLNPHRLLGAEWQSGGVWQNWVGAECLITFEHNAIIGSYDTWKRQYFRSLDQQLAMHPPDIAP